LSQEACPFRLLAILVAVVFPACAGLDPTEKYRSSESTAIGEYVIGSPDLIRVIVWQHPELSVEMPVRRDGMISIPLLDDVEAAGRTPTELKATITEGLSKSISRPNVTVAVISPDSQTVTVIGGVVQSGTFPLRKNMGVLDAVAAAGGFSPWANKNDVRVVRVVDDRRVSYRFSYRAFLAGDPEVDIFLQPGDVIVVPE
jgi:polysaccharide export outer membrane protein